jgi:hypothetical protein
MPYFWIGNTVLFGEAAVIMAKIMELAGNYFL